MHPLIVYYSYSGITRRLVEDIALITDGDLRELKPQKPYSFSHNTAVKEVREEMEKVYCLTLIQRVEDIENVEVIFIGSPNWLKTFAPPALSFLRKVDLSGKQSTGFIYVWQKKGNTAATEGALEKMYEKAKEQ